MSVPVLNAIMDFAVALGKENLSLGGATIELPIRTFLQAHKEVFRGRKDAACAAVFVLATPNGDVKIQRGSS